MSTFPDPWHLKLPFLMVESLLSISPACVGQLVKMIITIEPNGIFESNLTYFFILMLFSHWYAKWWQGFAKYQLSRSRFFSENAHDL